MEMTSFAPEEYFGGAKFVSIDTHNLIFSAFRDYNCVRLSNAITLCLDTRQPGSVFKKLDTRQSEIIIEIPWNNLLNFS